MEKIDDRERNFNNKIIKHNQSYGNIYNNDDDYNHNNISNPNSNSSSNNIIKQSDNARIGK